MATFPIKKPVPITYDEFMRKTPNMKPKTKGNTNVYFCSFFEGMETIQMTGIKSNETIWGIYHFGRLKGFFYDGENYSWEQVCNLGNSFLPKSTDLLDDFVKKNNEIIRYFTIHPNQYAWVYDRILIKK